MSAYHPCLFPGTATPCYKYEELQSELTAANQRIAELERENSHLANMIVGNDQMYAERYRESAAKALEEAAKYVEIGIMLEPPEDVLDGYTLECAAVGLRRMAAERMKRV